MFISKNFKMLSVLVILLLLNSTQTLTAQILFENTEAVKLDSSNLPIVILNTNGQAILDDPKIEADMKIIYNGEGKMNHVSDTTFDYNGKIGIEIRGSSSQMFPKKQYGFETRDEAGEELNVSLLGFPSGDDWIFFAPYNDKSLIRDALMYKISNLVGRYASRSKYCEMILNGEYMGVYVLFEKIKRNKNRVNITKMSEEDISGDAVTGGYIIKIDKVDPDEKFWTSSITPYEKARYVYEYPKSDNIVVEQENYIKNYITDFEAVMNTPNYADSTIGYPKFIDESSFIDFILLNEIPKNIDAYRISTFMHKDRDSKDGKLIAGPIWDFNLGFGNANYYDVANTQGWHLKYDGFGSNEDFLQPFYWEKLFDDAGFKLRMAKRWKEIRTTSLTTEKVLSEVDSLVNLLDKAQQRNFEKWPVLGVHVWPNSFVGQTYFEEVQFLKNWITARLAWMDSELNKIVNVENENLIPQDFKLSQNYPNPFNSSTIINYQIPFEGNVKLSVYDMLGREIAVLENSFKTAGNYNYKFDAKNFSTGIYFYRLQIEGAQTKSEMKKFVLLK